MNAPTTKGSHNVLLDCPFEIRDYTVYITRLLKITTSVSYEAPRMTQPHVLSIYR